MTSTKVFPKNQKLDQCNCKNDFVESLLLPDERVTRKNEGGKISPTNKVRQKMF